ncbi:Hypothetical protein R9X50_00618800 [Acrodontium crateriforme]|uniref:NAD(P)-binding protein n=1 Tax=Acrodontium crateriforme TaxID=150365 RepID=A0AAQ3MB39_9PEZI|nr:Hypothetical protein R9X50_00618800 [Acrodontium crateriforme]
MSKFVPTKMGNPMGPILIWEKFHPPQDVRVSFKGQTIIITGANTGVGFEAAIKFLESGAKKLILGVRSLKKGEDAQAKMEERTGIKGVVEVWQLDMLNYDSIQAFSKRASSELDRLDIAVLNAGVSATKYVKSTYGYESTLQVNVLSTTLLGLLLLPKLKTSKTNDFTPVLELIGSSSHTVIYDLAKDGNATPLEVYNKEIYFDPLSQYSVSKLFLEYAHAGLTKVAGTDVFVTSVCPGATRSELTRDARAIWYFRIILFFLELVQRTGEEGSRTYITGTTMGLKAQGRFIRDDHIQDPSPMLQGERGAKTQGEVWRNIVAALKQDVPDIDRFITT